MSAETTVFVEQTGPGGWWQVKVQYPGTKPHTLVSMPDREEAERAARGYALKYGWVFVE